MKSELFSYRPSQTNSKAVLFIHGFSGDYIKTWDTFPWILASDLDLHDWDLWTIGYPSTRRIDLNHWSKEPNLSDISAFVAQMLQQEPLDQYQSLAMVCHSMGGLIARRILIDEDEVASKVVSLTMFGTPNNGLKKASFISLLKAQVSDMIPSGEFITSLQKDWLNCYPGGCPPFSVQSVTGLNDDFVPVQNSCIPEIPDSTFHIQGDHYSIVKPTTHQCEAINLVKGVITQDLDQHSPETALKFSTLAEAHLDSPPLSDEFIESRMAEIAPDDEDLRQKVVELGLLMERGGRHDQSMEFLKQWIHADPDIQGTYAGRLKRRFLRLRNTDDWELSLFHYKEALERARTENDGDQIYYHAINAAFLYLHSPTLDADRSIIQAQNYAKLANDYCRAAGTNFWNLATLAESYLYYEQEENALQCYTMALSQKGTEQWMLESAGQQAFYITEELDRRGRPMTGFIDKLVKNSAEKINDNKIPITE